ncbi:MAG TPA: response regulator [Bradyrhizobium sp.]|nr:response regulator [Bradyrhizobium sp.]
MKVLLIDDDPLVRFALASMLQPYGYEVVTAENGRIGTRLLRTEHPDVVITDIIMPDQEGFETIIEIKREHPDTKVIAISGGFRQGNLDILPMARALGADAAIAKPFEPSQLIDEIKRLTIPLAA